MFVGNLWFWRCHPNDDLLVDLFQFLLINQSLLFQLFYYRFKLFFFKFVGNYNVLLGLVAIVVAEVFKQPILGVILETSP